MIAALAPRSAFLRHVATLVTGTALGQALTVGSSPILSRLYSPEAFGAFSMFLAVVAIAGPFSTWRYEAAIMLPDDDDESAAVVMLCLILAVASSALLLVALAAASPWLPQLRGLRDLGAAVWLLPVLLALQGIQIALRQWDNRHRAYTRMAWNGVLQSGTNAGGTVALGLARVARGLEAGALIAQAAATAAYVRSVWADRGVFVRQAARQRLVTAAQRYRAFVQYGMPALFTSRLAQQSLIMLAGFYLGPAVLGYIFLIHRVIGLPSSLVGTALGEVFYEKIARIPRHEAFPKLLAFSARLAALSTAIYAVMAVVLEWAFVPLFGTEWTGAVPFLRSLTLVALCSFVFAPLSVLFDYFEAQGLNLAWQAGWLITNVAVFAYCHAAGASAVTTLMVYAVKQALWYVAGIAAFFWVAWRAARSGPGTATA